MTSAWWWIGGAVLTLPAVLMAQVLIEPAHAHTPLHVDPTVQVGAEAQQTWEPPLAATVAQQRALSRPQDEALVLPGNLPALRGMPQQLPQPTDAEPIEVAAISPSEALGDRSRELDQALQVGCQQLDRWSDQLDRGEALDLQHDVVPIMRTLGDQMMALVSDSALTQAERQLLLARLEARARPSVERFAAAMQAHEQEIAERQQEPVDLEDQELAAPLVDPVPAEPDAVQ